MSAATTVFLKEVTENLRDRKTVFNALVMGPLFGPIFFAIMMGFIINKQLDSAEKPLSLPVVGAEHAPNLVAFLESQNIRMLPPPRRRLTRRVQRLYRNRWNSAWRYYRQHYWQDIRAEMPAGKCRAH